MKYALDVKHVQVVYHMKLPYLTLAPPPSILLSFNKHFKGEKSLATHESKWSWIPLVCYHFHQCTNSIRMMRLIPASKMFYAPAST